MKTAQLNTLFRLERKKHPATDFVDPTEEWEQLGEKVAGSLAPLSGQELLQARQLQTQVTHTLTFYWSATTSKLKGSDRAVRLSDGTVYELVSAVNLENRNYWVECQAIERLAA